MLVAINSSLAGDSQHQAADLRLSFLSGKDCFHHAGSFVMREPAFSIFRRSVCPFKKGAVICATGESGEGAVFRPNINNHNFREEKQ